MLTAVSGGYSNTVTYTYDDAGRKATEAFAMGSQTYTTSLDYDAAGQLIEYTYPDGTVVGRDYTDRGQLYQISYDTTTIDTRAYARTAVSRRFQSLARHEREHDAHSSRAAS